MATWWSLLLFLPVSARGIVKRPGLKQSFFNLNWLAGKWKMLRFLWDLQGRSRRRFYVAGQKLLASGLGFLQISCTSIPAKRKELCFELHHANFGKQRKKWFAKGTFSPPENFMQFWLTLWYDPGNWAERGILMSQDAESPDRPLVLVFYGWVGTKVDWKQMMWELETFLGNPLWWI